MLDTMGKKRTPLARFIVRERYRQGLSQEDLARKAGISPNSVTNIEVGRGNASPKTIYSIATALGVDGGMLFDLMEQVEDEDH